MNNRNLLLLVLMESLFQSCSNNSEQSPMGQFRGLWKMYSHEIKDDNRNWVEHNWMNGGVGYIIYDGEGHMAVHITPQGYQNTKVNWNKSSDTLSQGKYRSEFEIFSLETSKPSLANYVYVSNCRILDGNVIEHARLSHGNPEKFDEVVQRGFEFIGDTLILFPLNLEGQNQRRIKWVKQ